VNPTDLQSLLPWLVPLLVTTGLIGGVLAGLLSVGGGILSVPIMTLFGIPINRAAPRPASTQPSRSPESSACNGL